jgi:transcriptional regulator with XRE-family HTH domain
MAFPVSSASPAFGTILRRFRRAAGLSQEELAALAGLSTHAVGDLERGYRSRPRQETVILLREALQLNQEDQVLFDTAARHARRAQIAVSLPHDGNRFLCPPFVGRATERSRCERYLAGEENHLLFISGEPGVGKTRMVYEVGGLASAQGWGVLAASCRRSGAGESYGPLLDLILGVVRRQTPQERRVNLRGCAWLVGVLPELAETLPSPVPGWPLGWVQERRLVTAAIIRFLRNMAGPAGILLLLDDIHLADGATLELLPHLVRTMEDEADNLAIRVIATYRDTEGDSRTRFMRQLANLMCTQVASRLFLPPLEPDEASTLLELLLPDTEVVLRGRFRDQVQRRAGGVPYFLIHCAEQLRLSLDAPEAPTSLTSFRDEREAAGHRQGPPLPVPWIVAESIRQRLAELPDAGFDAVQIAAVAGHPVSDAALLEALMLTGHTEEHAVAGIEAADHARLLREATGPAYTFAYPLIRDVVAGDLGAARKILLRRRLGEVREVMATTAPEPGRECCIGVRVHISDLS